MTSTTTNYGWTVPTSSDLVKNGATAISTVASSVDTALWNSGFGQAGKNKIINGDFGINQRAFSSTTSDNTFTFDRWRTFKGGSGSVTYSAQTFTAGTAPVAGYEGKNFVQIATTSQTGTSDYVLYINLIESVRTFAGQTVTLSFWAKANSGTPKISWEAAQNFGTGGSPSADVYTPGGAATISTSWARYSLSITVPSISGKTIGTNNNDYLGMYFWLSAGSSLNTRSSSIGNQNNTFQIWGVQLEAGSTATPFQTATGTIQGELAACQRYYYRAGGASTYEAFANGQATSATVAKCLLRLPVTMRVSPTAIEYSTVGVADGYSAPISAVVTLGAASPNVQEIAGTVASGLTQNRAYYLSANNSTNAYIGVSAEL